MKLGNGKLKSLTNKKFIFLAILLAVFVRLLLILTVSALEGYIPTNLYTDDMKYEQYARIYSLYANKVIDLQAFEFTDFQMGGIVVAQLYFRLNAILFYLFNSVFVL